MKNLHTNAKRASKNTNPDFATLAFTEAMVRDLAKVASRLANAKYLKVDLLDEATVIMRTIDKAKRDFGYQPNPFDGAHLLDQPQIKKAHDELPAPPKKIIWRDLPGGIDDEQKRFEASKARRENARRKQESIDDRLRAIGIAAGSVDTWRDVEWLETESQIHFDQSGSWLLASLHEHMAACKKACEPLVVTDKGKVAKEEYAKFKRDLARRSMRSGIR
jgi:hypothetical protein